MVVNINNTDYTLTDNGIGTYEGSDGSKGVTFTVTGVSSLDLLIGDVSGDESIEVKDDAGEVTQTYEGYTIFVSILYTADGATTGITLRTLTYDEKIAELEESQSIQDGAIDDLANAVSDLEG